MIESTVTTYGGPYTDQEPVEDPTTQVDSDYFNRLLEDHSHVSRGCGRGWVKFTAINGGSYPVTITVADAVSVWGSGSNRYPTITKTAAGTYEIIYATSYTDDLGSDENVSIRFAAAQLGSNSGAGDKFAFTATSVPLANKIVVEISTATGSVTEQSNELPITVWFR